MGSPDPLRRILIIDDDVDYRKLLLIWLGSGFPGVELVEYDPPAQGLPPPDFDWAHYDLLLLDYNLGLDHATGLDILQAHQDHPAFPTTLMLTGAGTEDVAVRALKSGVVDYLRKEQITKELLQTAVKNAYVQHNLKRQRHSLLEEMRMVARQESEKLIEDYKKKFSSLRALEEKRMQQEKHKMTLELEQGKQQLARLEDEQKHAEISRRVLQDEIQKLKEELKAATDQSKPDPRLEAVQNRHDRVAAESKRLQTQLEKAMASVDKNHWKLDMSRTLETQLAKEAEDFKEDEEQSKAMQSEAGVTLLRRSQAKSIESKREKTTAKQKDQDLLNDIAAQLNKDK